MSMGFLALLTPCVFPMIPITISFFMHRSENSSASPVKSASVYMLGIVLTFTFLGMMLAILLGASGANQLAANPIVNMFIAFLFIYFALFGFIVFLNMIYDFYYLRGPRVVPGGGAPPPRRVFDKVGRNCSSQHYHYAKLFGQPIKIDGQQQY